MSLRKGWQQWVHNPRGALWRKVFVKVHLWTGMTLGLYLILMSVTGSAAVFRRDIGLSLMPRSYTGPPPPLVTLMERTADLHDNLMAADTGRMVNGIGAFALVLLILSGAILWWPGKSRWQRSLIVPLPSNTRRYTWHLHSALGFWSFILLAGYAVTGIYFAFPDPFEDFFNSLATDPTGRTRPLEPILQWFIRMHFGRYGTWTLDVLWAVIGLVPAVLFITGFIVWWQGYQARKAARRRLAESATLAGAQPNSGPAADAH